MKSLQKKEHFFFGENLESLSAILIYKRTHSNIFITLLDNNKKVVICKSSGIVKVGDNKKQKVATQAIEQIADSLIKIFNFYKIVLVEILLKSNISLHIFSLVRLLLLKGIVIKSFLDIKRFAHNGMRGRNPRRV
jgi:ribosomal protein S11